MKLGITFSHPHLKFLDLDVIQALNKALSMNFAHIRLGAYWSDVEKTAGNYTFSELEKILKKCEAEKQPVVITVGVKAPRWPEFYWPEHIPELEQDANCPKTQNKILALVKKSVRTLKKYQCITHWQVENEPLDPSGPLDKKIPFSFLKKEVEVVRQLDDRPVIINLWGNELKKRQLFPKATQIADIIGLELYPKQFLLKFLGKSFYRGPHQSDSELIEILKTSPHPLWLTELQAEPWEKNHQGYLSKNPGSINPEQLEKNIIWAQKFPFAEIHLWGFEYWQWQAKQGNNDYFAIVKRYL